MGLSTIFVEQSVEDRRDSKEFDKGLMARFALAPIGNGVQYG